MASVVSLKQKKAKQTNKIPTKSSPKQQQQKQPEKQKKKPNQKTRETKPRDITMHLILKQNIMAHTILKNQSQQSSHVTFWHKSDY